MVAVSSEGRRVSSSEPEAPVLTLVPHASPHDQWVYTAEAPSQLLDAFDELVEGPGTNVTLATAVEEAAGQDSLLHVLCTGQGAGVRVIDRLHACATRHSY